MKKITFSDIDENVYYEKLSNGIDVYYYPTEKTKNFYITISVKYGGKVKKYTINDVSKEIIPGSAHFLEHKIMNFTNKSSMSKKMNELGLYANAYTSYDITNYNLYGSKDIFSSLKLLFDLFYNPVITERNVESEKGIICEEYKMYINNPNFRINRQVISNVFNTSYLKDVLVGNTDQINSISKEKLIEIYNDFYNTENTFIIITGNFSLNEVNDYVINYMKKIKRGSKKKIQVNNNFKEDKQVVNSYMEIEEDISTPKVIYSLKINKKDLNEKNNIIRRIYINFICSSLFSNTSDMYEYLKEKDLMISMSYSIIEAEKDYLVNISVTTNNPDKLIATMKKQLKKVNISNSIFIRKKKIFLNELFLNFENIEDVEYLITNNIIKAGRIIDNSKEILDKLNYKDLIGILKLIDFNNSSILKITPTNKNSE